MFAPPLGVLLSTTSSFPYLLSLDSFLFFFVTSYLTATWPCRTDVLSRLSLSVSLTALSIEPPSSSDIPHVLLPSHRFQLRGGKAGCALELSSATPSLDFGRVSRNLQPTTRLGLPRCREQFHCSIRCTGSLILDSCHSFFRLSLSRFFRFLSQSPRITSQLAARSFFFPFFFFPFTFSRTSPRTSLLPWPVTSIFFVCAICKDNSDRLLSFLSLRLSSCRLL